MYTFVILTDPVPPPSSIPTRNSEGYSIANASAALSGRSSFGTGGGIPGTGGMSLKGVLLQIYRGPWVDNVVKNPLLRALEREERIVEPNLDAEEQDSLSEAQEKIKLLSEKRLDRTQGVDTDAFREGLEKGTCPSTVLTIKTSPQQLSLADFTHPSSSLASLAHSIGAKQALSPSIIIRPLVRTFGMLLGNGKFCIILIYNRI